MHGDSHMVEKDVALWTEEAEMLDHKQSKFRLSNLEAIIREDLGKNSQWKIYRDAYPNIKR